MKPTTYIHRRSGKPVQEIEAAELAELLKTKPAGGYLLKDDRRNSWTAISITPGHLVMESFGMYHYAADFLQEL